MNGLEDLGEGTGEPAMLRRACASRKAPTEMRCDDSPTLGPRGLGNGDGDGLGTSRAGVGTWISNEEEGPTWRNDLRLKEESDKSSKGSVFGSWATCKGGVDFDLDFATCVGWLDLVHEKKDFFAEFGADFVFDTSEDGP